MRLGHRLIVALATAYRFACAPCWMYGKASLCYAINHSGEPHGKE